MDDVRRCAWATGDQQRYHDEEWGVPVHDEVALFELLTLEGAQAGLSWSTILKRRANYVEAFDGFDPDRVAAMGLGDVDALMANQGLIRHRGKLESVIANAKCLTRMHGQGETLDDVLWSFVGGTAHQHDWRVDKFIAASTAESTAMSKGLRRRGFSFVGPTICYALMQAAGLVNDHELTCFRREEVRALDGS